MLIKGSDLTAAQRQLVLAAFVHRHTIENAKARGVDCVNCADIGRWPYVAGQALPGGPTVYTRAEWHHYHTTHGSVHTTDAKWLATHAFHFTKDGQRLMARPRYAEPVYLAT